MMAENEEMSVTPKSKKERLLEIQELFDEGLISEDERESQRARVLAEI